MTDLAPNASLKGLKELKLDKLVDVSTSAGLSSLTELDLQSTGVQSLAGIEGMSERQTCNMRGVQATDNAALATLTGLVSLDAMGNGFTSLVGVPPATTANIVPEFNPAFLKVTTRVQPAWGENYHTLEDVVSAMDRYAAASSCPSTGAISRTRIRRAPRSGFSG